MTLKLNKKRISVPFSEPIYDLVMNQAAALGVSPSYYIANIVAQQLITQKQMMQGINDLIKQSITEKKGELNDKTDQ
jgi:hypothetical protein